MSAALTLRSWLGRGSVFAISLPRVATRSVAPIAHDLERDDTPSLPLRVLVVDNDATVLEATRQLLSGWGASVVAAAGPEAALAAAAELSPQAWVLDYHLDDEATGDALHLALMARHPRGVGIIVSADHGEAVRQAVIAVGATPLTKPLKALRLKSLLAKLAQP
jgi:CheY-like chemotaxis protein